jgi:hypothetical protein
VVRELRAFQPLEGDAAALGGVFEGDAAGWLPDATGAGSALRMTVRAGGLERHVRVTLGEPWHASRTTWRSLSWEPLGTDADATQTVRVLPTLDGELGLHVDETGRPTLVLDARYQPPGGLLGTAIDAVALHRIARVTGENLLRDIGAGLRALASERSAPEHAGPAPRG